MGLFDDFEKEYFDNRDAIKLNRRFKDSAFRYIFSDAKEFVELYDSLTGIKLNSDEIEPANLDSLVISDWHNDVSFLSKDRHIILFLEQQSSLCANMSVRCLVYYSNLIRKLYEENDGKFKQEIYSNTLVKIPKPEFYILYLGSKELKKSEECLHEHFHDLNRNMIDLKVVNVDIHYNKLNKTYAQSLRGYSYLVDRYYFHAASLKKKDGDSNVKAISLAVEDCRKKGLLLKYLDRKEFLVMVKTDFTFNDYVMVKENDARKEGIEKGIEKGIESLLTTLKELGYNKDFILEKLEEKYSVSLEEAQKYYDKFI